MGIAYQDDLAAVEQALAQYGTTYPIGMDTGDQIAEAYGITGIPETFVVDSEGYLAYLHIGPVTAETLSAELADLLGSQSE